MSNSKRCPFCTGWIPLPFRETDRAFEKHKKACDPEGYARQRAFVRELLGGSSVEDDEIQVENLDAEGNPIAAPTETKPKRARKAAEPKPAKAPRVARTKFPGTYTKEQAEAVVTAEAANEKPDFGSSRSWTTIVAGQSVAPKWLAEKMTGVPVGEFVTADAVKLLEGLGLPSTKAAA